MATVMVFGTFDLFHQGHEFFLRQAKKHGDHLLVCVARDKTVVKLKGRTPVEPELKRLAKLQSLSFVDEVFMGSEGDKYGCIERYKPDIICLGYDQTYFTDNLGEELKKRGLSTKVIRITESFQPEKFKSSKLRASKV